jgi:thioredoxin
MNLSNSIKALFLLIIMSSCGAGNGQKSQQLSVDEFEKKLGETKTAQLLDVRTPEEYAERHLKEAVNINFNADDFIDKVDHLDKSKPVFVYCLSGGRSAKAAALISKKGFKEVYEMKGGVLAWSEAKKPMELPGGEGNEGGKSADKGMSMDDYLAKVKSDKLILVDFNAVWCGPCKIIKPTLDKLAEKHKDKMELLAIDVDQNPKVADAMHIQGIPLMILYKGGKEVWRQMGLTDEKSIEKEIKTNAK